jgi:hypothetical protein
LVVAALAVMLAWAAPAAAVYQQFRALNEEGKAVPNADFVMTPAQGFDGPLTYNQNTGLVFHATRMPLLQLTRQSSTTAGSLREPFTTDSFINYYRDTDLTDKSTITPQQRQTFADLGAYRPRLQYNFGGNDWTAKWSGTPFFDSRPSGGSPYTGQMNQSGLLGLNNFPTDVLQHWGVPTAPSSGLNVTAGLRLECEGRMAFVPMTGTNQPVDLKYGENCNNCCYLIGSQYKLDKNYCFTTQLPAGIYQTQAAAPPQDVPSQWAFKKLGLPLKPPKEGLVPVTVAIIDTGLDYSHPQIRPEQLWVNPEPGTDPDYKDDVIGWNFVADNNNPWDDNGHGTFVAGLILAVNPAVRIMPLKAMDTFGSGLNANIGRAVVYAVDHGARVINVSLGTKAVSALQQDVVDYARARDVVIVVAAGNEGIDTSGFTPAGARGALTVASTDQNDKKPPFGNWGQNVALAAPGVDIVSLRARWSDFVLVATGGKDYKSGANILGAGGWLYRASGTSFSAPLVTGAAAFIRSLYPNLSGRQVERMLVESADDIEVAGWDQFTGAGRLNMRRAIFTDPNYYLTAKVSGIAPTQQGGQTVIRVTGTAVGSQLASYQIQLAQGESPTGWKTVITQKDKSVEGAVLADIPVKEITGRGKWTIRLVVQDAGGKTKEARGSLNVR